jgi:hypothetical protein
MIIGGAGYSPLCDVATDRLTKTAKHEKDFFANSEEIVSDVLTKVHARHIWPRPEWKNDRGISLVVGIHDRTSGQDRLYKTYEEVVQPSRPFACAGVGEDLGNYFLDRLFEENLNSHQATSLLAFIVSEAKGSVSSVGRDTQFASAVGDGMGSMKMGPGFEARHVPSLSDCFRKFWKDDSG